MKKLWTIFVLLFSLISSTHAQQEEQASPGLTNVGFATFNLTAKDFNCNGFLNSVSPLKELHVVFLYNTFGNNFSCLNRLLDDPRLRTLEVNLINEPGHRNGRLGRYEFLAGIGDPNQYSNRLANRDAALKRKFVSYISPLQTLLSERLKPSTTLFINPGLESNVSVQAARVLVSWARESFPDARVVWNPFRASLNTRKVVKADIIEGHGPYPAIKAPCIFNMDGTDVKYRDRPALNEDTQNYIHAGPPLFQTLEKYANVCEVAFVWTQESNGLSATQGFKDPRSRRNFISTDSYKRIMKDVIDVHRRGVLAPTTDTYTQKDNAIVSTCDVVSVNFEDGAKSGRLLKQSMFPDRGAVLILPRNFVNVRRITLYKGTKIVDRFFSSGTYHDGRSTFRSNVSPTTYPLNTYLAIDSGSTRYCYKLSNPRIRLD